MRHRLDADKTAPAEPRSPAVPTTSSHAGPTLATDERRAFALVGAILALALVANIATGNGLWLGYTVVGTATYLVLLGLVRHYGWRIPPSALLAVGATAGLHYLGGSAAGLHDAWGLNGAYFVFPWWDNVAHALGSAAIAIAAYATLRARTSIGHRGALVFLAICVAATTGVLVELYEFAGFLLFQTVDQGFYTNTLLDLYNNLLGATVGASMYALWAARAPEASAQADTRQEATA